VRETDSFQNMNEARRAMQNYREWVRQQEQNLFSELTSRAEQQGAELQKALAAPTAPEPVPAPQPDALAQERARLAEQQQRIALHTHFQRLSAQGQAAANELAQLQQWAAQSYTPGELAGQQPVQGDERSAWLAEASRRYNELEAVVRNANSVAAAQQQQIAAARQQQIDRWGKGQDDEFNRQLADRHPHLAANPEKMRRAATDYIKKTTGLNEAQITREWRNGRWRSAPEQMWLADAVSHEMARQSVSPQALAAHRRPPPPVQQPGTYRPRGAASEDEMRDLYRQLDGAKGDRAIKIATRIGQLKRDAS
jgi:hypothetical protein